MLGATVALALRDWNCIGKYDVNDLSGDMAALMGDGGTNDKCGGVLTLCDGLS